VQDEEEQDVRNDAQTTEINKQLLQEVILGEHRSQGNKDRDQYRHPLDTLQAFHVQPDMTVVELWPGGKGWYTEILAPYLKENGKLYTAHFSSRAEKPYFVKNLQKFKQKMAEQPDLYENVVLTVLQPPQFLEIAPKGSVDRVLTFRNFHNWMKSDQIENVLLAAYKALKPGGILGIVEHRGLAGDEQDPKATSGYVKELYVIKLVEKVGFVFSTKSEINANVRDTTNYPKGVWTLLPSLKLKNQDKDKYLAIGESDRMTLQFIKPLKQKDVK
jgi:predicted methyltransferase